MARFAAVPGILGFVWAIRERGLLRLFGAALAIGMMYLVYMMQSRGSMISMGFSAAVLVVLAGGRARKLGLVAAVAFALVLACDMIPEDMSDRVSTHVLRGQSAEEFGSFTGRTRAWQNAMREIVKSPLWGWGPQADRYLISEHVHNTYVYALLQAGFPGLIFFCLGLGLAWRSFWRVYQSGAAVRWNQETFLLQAGGILAFFTVRSVPEVCGSMFGVDTVLLVPILTFLGVAERQLHVDARDPA
jgi:O-antigen ligase